MIQSLKILAAILKYPLAELKEIALDLTNNNYSNHYYTYEKRKKNGKSRTISPPVNKLKVIQSRLITNVFSHVKFPYFVVGSIKKRSAVINAKIHSGKKYHFQTDLSNFFGFVTSKKVYNSLITRLGFSSDVASLITKLTTYKGHLPQGAPTSPFLSNLAGLDIDNLFFDEREKLDITYTRYIDDITFSADFDFKSLTTNFLERIRSLGYPYSNQKTTYKVGNIDITGVKSGCNGLKITNKQFDRIISSDGNSSSINGLLQYMNHVEAINRGFTTPNYKRTNTQLLFPEKLFPNMNYPKEGMPALYVAEYFEDLIYSREN